MTQHFWKQTLEKYGNKSHDTMCLGMRLSQVFRQKKKPPQHINVFRITTVQARGNLNKIFI